jgi:hypothetical protein
MNTGASDQTRLVLQNVLLYAPGFVLLNRAGVRFSLDDPNFGKDVKNEFALDLELPG